VRYEYDGNDVYRLLMEEEDRGRVVALLIWVSDLRILIYFMYTQCFRSSSTGSQTFLICVYRSDSIHNTVRRCDDE